MSNISKNECHHNILNLRPVYREKKNKKHIVLTYFIIVTDVIYINTLYTRMSFSS